MAKAFQARNNDIYDFRQLTLWEVGEGSLAIDLSNEQPIKNDFEIHAQSLPAVERPRERLLVVGPGGLATAELLSLIVGNDNLSLAQRIIAKCQEVSDDFILQLRHITVEELKSIHGIGEAKAATIVAAVELGKRLYQPRPRAGTNVDSPEAAKEVFAADLMWATQECFGVLFLDVKHRIISSQVVTIGSATDTLAHPREIFGEAVRRRASRILVAHNHPSDHTPQMWTFPKSQKPRRMLK